MASGLPQGSSHASIWQVIEKIWGGSGAWPEYIEVMRLALHSESEAGQDPTRFARLPGLICAAAGGYPEWADPISAAWMLFYTAAHLMDAVEDQDEPDAWWAESGPGLALNAATGLFFTASLALDELYHLPLPQSTLREAARLMLIPFLQMSSGQFADYRSAPQNLAEYWRVAETKSGAFFALACSSAARLATPVPEALAGYHQFGLNLGLIIQILDDLGDIRNLVERTHPIDPRSLRHSLIWVYVHEVCSPQIVQQFERLAGQPRLSEASAQSIASLIQENGGVLYLSAELQGRYGQAKAALEEAQAREPARSNLIGLVDRLVT